MSDPIFTREDVVAAIQSWLAYSAGSACFTKIDSDVKLLLGIRGQPAQSIPEPGQYCLIGGFNTEVPGPAMLHDAANAHIKAMLGLDRHRYIYSDFQYCEYEMAEITEPLKTKLGALPIKRLAFTRPVWLYGDGVSMLRPQGKLSGCQWFSMNEFEALIATGEISFPHQVDQVRGLFAFAIRYQSGLDGYGLTWSP